MSEPITAIGPDGTRHVFPAGTPDEVVDRVMREVITGTPVQQANTQSAANAVAASTGRRSLWERFGDRVSDTVRTSAPVAGYRRGFQEGATANDRTAEEARKVNDRFEINPAVLVGRINGSISGLVSATASTLQGDGTEEGVAYIRDQANTRVANERTRRQELAVRDDVDGVFDQETLGGKVVTGVVSVLGVLTGAAADPTSYLSAGRSVITRASTQMLLAGGADALAQESDMGVGLQSNFDVVRSALSVAAGGLFSTIGDLGGAGVKELRARFLGKPEVTVRADLETGDALMAHPLSTEDIPPTPPRTDAAPVGSIPEGATNVTRIEGGGRLPGDVWDPALNAWVHRRDGPTTEGPKDGPEGTTGTQDGPSGNAAPEKPDGALASPEAPPAGDGAGGWQDVDWGARRSPERVTAAVRHLDGLQKWIKPEAVADFTRLLDNGIDGADEGVHINERWVDWEKMGDPQEILGFTNAIADIFSKVYDKAGTDVGQSWEKTAQIAKQMGFTLSDLIKTHSDVVGEGGLTARSGALRDAALASDKALADEIAAVRSALATGDKSGLPAFAASLNRTILLSAMDAGAAAEIARALQYRQHLAGPQVPRNDLKSAMDELSTILNKGGKMDDDELGAVLDGLADSYASGGSAGLRGRIRTIRELGILDYVGYYGTASLLSAPTTHIRNATGTPIHALFQVAERYVAAGIGTVRTGAGLGSRERVTFREANAYVAGILQSWNESLGLAAQAWKRGAPVSDMRSGWVPENTAHQVPYAWSPARAAGWKAKPLSPSTWVDAGMVALFATQRTLGFRPSVAVDELYKGLGRRMQLNALAFREAAYRSAVAGPGPEADAVFAKTLATIQDSPTAEAFREAELFFLGKPTSARGQVQEPGSREEEMALVLRSIDTRRMAADHAKLLTFQNSGPITDKIDAALRAVPLVKHLFVPFVRTPIALLNAGMVQRNPVIGGIMALGGTLSPGGRARHAALFKALLSEEQALERGGAEADLVVARQMVGSAVLGSLWMLWAGGNVTGKQTQQERQSGIADYSVRLPNGTWVQYSGMSPAGEMIGLVADTASELRKRDPEDHQGAAVIGALAAAIRNNVVNKSFLAGLFDFMEMATGGAHGAPEGKASGERLSSQLAGAVIPRALPASSLLRRVAQEIDPVTRDAKGWIEETMAMIPLMSETLASQRDFLGRPMVRPEGSTGVFQAFNTTRPGSDALENALSALAQANVHFDIGLTPKGDMDRHEYSRLLEVQGQLYRDRATRLNMEESLRALVASPEYLASQPEAQEFQVKRIITRFRTNANRAVRDHRSEFYMAEWARRSGAEKWRTKSRQRGWSPDQARGQLGAFGLTPDDQEVQDLEAALSP